MWDAWAAYDPTATGVFVDEDRQVDGETAGGGAVDGGPVEGGGAAVTAAREEAMSFAVFRILVQRYLLSPGAEQSVMDLEQLMDDLCYDRSFTDTEGDSPAAFGNRIAEMILAETIDDGSNEADGYVDDTYQPVNAPLVVRRPGTAMVDPNRWQPLELDVMVAQNGMPLDETVQTFVGSQWGAVTPFALDPALSATVDIGPASMGNAPLGTYDDRGHDLNPATGEPYEPNVVALGDYGRVVAEFWADGPSSETPPGHWNTIANSATDALDGDLRLRGEGPAVEPLEWDVKLYLALNGGMHDAAVAAWGSKRSYDYTRPISMIRYLGGLGQSSDPDGDAYHPDGLPLEPGLIEVITEESSAPGARHEALAQHAGEVVVWSWLGTPEFPDVQTGGVGWTLAVDWVPYQLSTFVTPAFAGYVSLQWATYADAADEAGVSRLYGGIHVWADDLRGRVVGSETGRGAWALARRYFDGTIDER